jgi:Ca-activated chloride channel family protein
MFRFGHSEFLYLLAGIPVLIIIYIIAYGLKKKSIRKFGNPEVVSQLMPDISGVRSHLKFVILTLALIIMIFAISGPQFGSKLKEIKRKGIEIIIALDISNSMLAEDIKPDRLERSKQAILRLLDQLENDRIGLIVFAGDAYTQVPITTDYDGTRMFLNNINTDIVSRQGTAIDKAIRLASNSFSPDAEANKAIIIISDGENHEGDAIQAAEQANEKGIKIYTIGMGSQGGAPIPVKGAYYQKEFLKDRQGNVVTSKLNSKMLSQIAVAGGGKYYHATSTNAGLNKLFNDLDKLDKVEIDTKVYSEYEEQFPVLVWMALALIVLNFLILERKNKWLKNIKIYKLKL